MSTRQGEHIVHQLQDHLRQLFAGSPNSHSGLEMPGSREGIENGSRDPPKSVNGDGWSHLPHSHVG